MYTGNYPDSIIMLWGGVPMDPQFEERKRILAQCKSMAATIMKGFQDENSKKRLDTISMLEEIPDLAADKEMKEMKDYGEIKGILKKVYIESARTIMKTLETEYTFVGDKEDSFNYKEPLEPIQAAECIKILPNAFIAGPMKTAILNKHEKVRRIAVEYYDSLPTDLKYSGIFPEDFPQLIKRIKSELPG